MNITKFSCFYLGWVFGALVMGQFGFPPTKSHLVIGFICAIIYGIWKRDKKAE